MCVMSVGCTKSWDGIILLPCVVSYMYFVVYDYRTSDVPVPVRDVLGLFLYE